MTRGTKSRRTRMDRRSGPRMLAPGNTIQGVHFDGSVPINPMENGVLGSQNNLSDQPFVGMLHAQSIGSADNPVKHLHVATVLHKGATQYTLPSDHDGTYPVDNVTRHMNAANDNDHSHHLSLIHI